MTMLQTGPVDQSISPDAVPIHQGEEPLRSFEPLHEEYDGLRGHVVQAPGQVVAQVEDDLRPATDDARPADPRPGVQEGIGDATRLGDRSHPFSAGRNTAQYRWQPDFFWGLLRIVPSNS